MSCDGGWYRDAARVLCGFGEGPPGSFSIRSSDGGDPVRLTTYPFGPNCNGCDQPTDISPSGKRFVFVRFKDENTDHGTAALFVKRLRGGPEHQITQYGLAVQNEFADARWSPDGRRIISSSTDGRLFTVRPNGTGLAQIPLDTGTQDYNAFEPAWSPDGRQIVFCMFINGQEDVYTASRDGGHLGQITHTPDFENGPDWGREPIHKP
jgi:Tol biopolymer transport system component